MKTKVALIILPLLALPMLVAAQTSDTARQLTVANFASAVFLVAVVAGVLVNLWKITHKWGGIIGAGLRLIGIGIVFLSIEALDRAIESISTTGVLASFLGPIAERAAHDLLLVLALFFVTMGFVKFYTAVKT